MRNSAFGQGVLAFPPPPKEDFSVTIPPKARAELREALALAKAALVRPPWDYREQRYWRVVFRQMSGWLPADEQAAMCAEFYPELERIELLFPANERAEHGRRAHYGPGDREGGAYR